MKNIQSNPASLWRSSLVFLFILASLTACKKDDSDPTPSNGVEGTWKINAITVSPAQSGISDLVAFIKAFTGNDCITRITFDFKSNGTIGGSVPTDCQSTEDLADEALGVNDQSTWKVEGNKIILTSGSDVSEYDLQVSGSTMNWSFKEVDSTDGMTYTYTIVFNRA